jgi:hypothetical protein
MIGRRSFITGLGALAAAVTVPARAVYTYVKRASLPPMQWRIFNNGAPYGRGPMMDALPAMRAYNALPPEERARAAAWFVDDMIERGEWGND